MTLLEEYAAYREKLHNLYPRAWHYFLWCLILACTVVGAVFIPFVMLAYIGHCIRVSAEINAIHTAMAVHKLGLERQ